MNALLIIILLVAGYFYGMFKVDRRITKRINDERRNPSLEEARILVTMLLMWPLYFNEMDIIVDHMAIED